MLKDTYLIVTADDFGRSRSTNRAVELAAKEGILCCASMMVCGDAFREAVQIAGALPSLQVALHLSLTGGTPLYRFRKSLLSSRIIEEGRFRRSPAQVGLALQLSKSIQRQVKLEVAAQFKAFAATGLPFTHVDSHHHLHIHPKLFELVLENAAEYGLKSIRIPYEPWKVSNGSNGHHRFRNRIYREIFPRLSTLCRKKARSADLIYSNGVFGLYGSGDMTEKRMLGILDRLEGLPGIFELYTHPSVEPGTSERMELKALLSHKVKEAIRKKGIRLIRYIDVPRPERTVEGTKPTP